ncbi:MAG: EamA family transporter [Sinobacteraceae bacterium]|nr:EamA family transporter [Nevskiaceae bacterium]
MHAPVVGLALITALLHAIWNTLLRSGVDRLWSITVMSFATSAAALVALPFLPVPAASCWPYIAVSAVLQVAYSIFLASAYRHGELSQVYPIIRGCVPLLVAFGGYWLANQHLGYFGLIGLLMVSLGIGSLALGSARLSTKGLLLALATALFVASYVTADGIGVRLAANALSYAAWIFLVYGILMPLTFLLIRRRLPPDVVNRETLKALTGGTLSVVSYGATLAALSIGNLGPVSALRETSVIISALLGRFVLNERLTKRRVLACVVVAIGAACVGYEA